MVATFTGLDVGVLACYFLVHAGVAGYCSGVRLWGPRSACRRRRQATGHVRLHEGDTKPDAPSASGHSLVADAPSAPGTLARSLVADAPSASGHSLARSLVADAPSASGHSLARSLVAEARREGDDESHALHSTAAVPAPPSPSSSTSTAAYFLAGRHASWWAVACSFFASNIGSETLVGLSGNGARYGLPVATFDWASPLLFLLLGWVFSPLYTRARVFTTNEWVERRFSRACRTYLAIVTIFLAVVTKLSMSLIAGGVVLQSMLGWNMWVSIVVLVAVTGVYVVAGGMTAVIYTEVVQTGVLLVGSFLLLALSLQRVGGVSGLQDAVQPDMLHVFSSDGPYPWLGLLLGYPFLGIWFHCTDQEMVQRSMTAKVLPSRPADLHAKAGCVAAGFLKFIPPFTFCISGIIARILFPKALGIGCTPGTGEGDDECGPGFDVAFPVLVERLMPPGALGLMVAAMLAALMSTLASTFNSSSTVFTVDVYAHLRPNASQAHLVRVGRAAACGFVLLAIVWVPVVYMISDTLYLAVQSLIAVAAAPIAVLFLLGAFVPRVNATGAMWGLAIGHAAGAVRLVAVVVAGDTSGGPLVHSFVSFNFLEFAAATAAATAAIMLLVSHVSARRTPSAPPTPAVELTDISTHTSPDDSPSTGAAAPPPTVCGLRASLLVNTAACLLAASVVAIFAVFA